MFIRESGSWCKSSGVPPAKLRLKSEHIQCPFWSRAFIGGAVFSSLVFTAIPTFSLSMVSPCPHKFVYALRPKKWLFETEQPSPLSADGRRHTDAFSSLHSVSFFVRRECEKVFPKKKPPSAIFSSKASKQCYRWQTKAEKAATHLST